MPHFSVVIPVYKCADSIAELSDRLLATLHPLHHDFEIIYVNDGSPDKDWEVVLECCKKDQRIKGLSLSRNFGQHLAITAGLKHSRGLHVVVMDGDLQDLPECIPTLYQKYTNENYDAVVGERVVRNDSFIKKLSSKAFYWVYSYFTGTKTSATQANFGVYSRKVIDNYLRLTEHARVFPLLVRWQGFKIGFQEVEHGSRLYGKSAYNFSRSFDLAIDAIVSLSNKPLRLTVRLGFYLSTLSLILLSWIVVRSFYLDTPIGWSSLIASIFLVGGLLIAFLGLIGVYIGKIYDEVKNRPLYIVDKTENFTIESESVNWAESS